MNKRLKHIVAAALVIGTFTTVMYGNAGVINASASTYNSASSGQLKSLSVYRGTGKEVQLYSNLACSKETDLTSDTDYYIELKGSEGIDISAEAEGTDYVVKVFTSNEKDAKGYDPSEIGFIPIDYGNTKIYVRTYRSEDDYNDASDNKNVIRDAVKSYTLHIYRDRVNSDDENDIEYPYLKSIYLSDGKINFSKDKMNYDVNVEENIQEMIVRAKPDNDNDLVEINGDSVDEDGDYEKTVKLNKGENNIKITVQNDDETVTYTVVVNRGGNTENSSTSNTVNNINKDSDSFLYKGDKRNSMITEDGKYMYINSIGQAIKNKWWFDIKTGYDYYFDENGYAKTGWAQIGGNWYYFNNSAQMQKGWLSNAGKWYYLNDSGAMQTGWYKDLNGKWYFLSDDGSMKTGWLYNDSNWYLFNSDGSMVTGHVLVDGIPYSFDSNGKMI